MNERHWQKSYGDIPKEIDADLYPSVVAMMGEAIARFSDKVAFHCLGHSLTYKEVDERSRAFAAYLQSELGVKKGDRIAVMSPNLAAFPIAFLGIVRAGAIQVNVNPLYTPRELEHQLNDSGSTVVLVYAGVSGTVAEIVDRTKVRSIITIAPGDGMEADLPGPPVDPRLAGAIGFGAAIRAGIGLPFTPPALSGSDVLFLQYTGGTTGLSKGATLTHRNLVANVQQFKAFMGADLTVGDESIVTAIPLYHIFALMVNFITYFSVGAENWLVPDPRDFEAFLDVLKQSRMTAIMGVNTLYAALVAHPRTQEVDFSRLRVSGGGGAAIMQAVSDKWTAMTGTIIREGYGLSETAPIVSFNPTFVREFTATTGFPAPSTDIKLLDEDDNAVPVGQRGEICVKGPQVMLGYWEKPEINATAFTPDGYFRTGDIGEFDEAGYLKVVDRKKDMIIVSGFNVFPTEIEAVATSCPGVLECACVGAPDPKTGEAVKLYIVKTQGATLTEEDVIAHCRRALTAYKIPRQINFVAALPKTNVGKILRRDLRQTA